MKQRRFHPYVRYFLSVFKEFKRERRSTSLQKTIDRAISNRMYRYAVTICISTLISKIKGEPRGPLILRTEGSPIFLSPRSLRAISDVPK